MATPDGRRAHALLVEAEAAWATARASRRACPALVGAAAAGRGHRVSQLLHSGAQPDSLDAFGCTAVHVAAARGDATMLDALLKAGASANLPCGGPTGARPLHCAALRGSLAAVRTLLRGGADPRLSDQLGRLPAEVCARWGTRARGALLDAMREPHDARRALVTRLAREGPVGVLRLLDAGAASKPPRDHAATGTRSTHAASLSLAVELAGFGVTVVDESPAELVYAWLGGLSLQLSASIDEQRADLSVAHVQIDSCLEATKHPVLLAPLGGNEMAGGGPQPTLRLSVIRQMGWEGMLFVQLLALAVQPLGIALEQNLAARLFRFAAHLPRKPVPPAYVAAESSLSDVRGIVTEPPTEIFLRELALHPMSAALTIQMEPLCDDPNLQRFHPTHELVGLAQQLLSLRSATLKLDALLLDDARFASLEALTAKVSAHYQSQALRGLYRLIGSLDLLGNPAALFSDIGGGVRTFFYEPSSGLVSSGAGGFAAGVAKGTAGLAGGLLGGTGATVFGAASGLTRLVGEAAGGLALDDDFYARRRAAAQVRAEDVGQGFAMGVRALGEGFREGAAGVLAKPLQGAMDDGARGFVKGLGRGLLGVAAKPLSGVASLVSKTAEGIAADAKDLAARDRRTGGAALRSRIRQPRVIGPDRVLLPYPRRPPIVAEQVDAEAQPTQSNDGR